MQVTIAPRLRARGVADPDGSTGSADLNDAADQASEGQGAAGADDDANRRRSPQPLRNRRKWTVLCLVVAITCGGLGGWFAIEAQQARAGADMSNRALLDAGATAEVSGRIGDALEKLFSYRYDDPKANRDAAGKLLTGKARGQYERLFSSVRAEAEEQRLVLRSTVVVAGVQRLTDRRAELLVFLDQSATRGDNGSSSSGAAQLSVRAEQRNGDWLITGMRAR